MIKLGPTLLRPTSRNFKAEMENANPIEEVIEPLKGLLKEGFSDIYITNEPLSRKPSSES